MSIRLYVGNLPKELERAEFEALFAEYDDLVSVKLITDKKTNKCRGFGFVTVKTDEQAEAIIAKFDGQAFQDTTLKLEKAMPRKTKEKEVEAPASTPRRKPSGASGNKSRRAETVVAGSTAAASSQPDPRWASDLAKLKELLAAQTASS